MSTLEELIKIPVKTTPDVWIKRLVILSKLSPDPIIIRDVPLKKGLNIVWAEEPDANDDSDVAGHSAGKTSFCRLIRYVLGEKTYGNKANASAIKTGFSNGYVAAELSIKGANWAVLRPLGDNRNSYILRDSSVENLIDNRTQAAHQDSYPKLLGLDSLLDGLASSTVVRTNEEIKWGHLLAWCTRDQEARFQNIYDWRSPRSESEWPSFRFPKADPLFVMRIALGLFLSDELVAEENLAKIAQNLEREEVALDRAKKEPEFWINHYDQKLRQQLKSFFPSDQSEIDVAPPVSDEITLDLKRFVSKAQYLNQEAWSLVEADAVGLQQQLDDINEQLAQARNESNRLKGLFKIDDKAGQEIDSGLKRDENFRTQLGEYKDRVCPFGDVLIGKCSYVIQRQNEIKGSEIKDLQALEQQDAVRDAARKRLLEQQSALDNQIQQFETERVTLNKKHTDLLIDVKNKKSASDALGADLGELLSWKTRLEAPDTYDRIKAFVANINKLKLDVDTETVNLNILLSKHDANRALLSSIFSGAAKHVLPSSSYDGKMVFTERELNFQITHGGAMSGEAMETLAVLLTDISCLVFNCLSKDSVLPGFLLHDSPREADLGLRLYHNYIRFSAWLDEQFSKSGDCPFQYILTTTTSPPKALQKGFVALRLDASKENELLFRRDLSKPPDIEQLEMLPSN